MDQTPPLNSSSPLPITKLIRLLGPGIMMAAAAVGGSHLVASTKAGAIYGWQLAGLILLVNILKYPFFRAGVQYTMGTGKSLVEGYSLLGRFYLYLYAFLCIISAFINTAALVIFSANLLGYFLPVTLPITWLSTIIVAVCLAILIAGHYRALDLLSKFIMATLSIATVVAVLIALDLPASTQVIQPELSPWNLAAIGFIVITMGWMPAPIEISSITSMWLKNQKRHHNVTAQSAFFDFNVGYIGTTLLALIFLALGALIIHGSGAQLSSSGVGFTHQLVGMYATTIGEWSRYLIAIIAFFCIFGSTITVIDGYARVISESQRLLKRQPECNSKVTQAWMWVISICAIIILLFFSSSLMPMLNFAMIMAFITTPFFALLNYLLINNPALPSETRSGKILKSLSILGLVYLFGFLAIFVWWKWFI
ncbi:divalent metal cation transporter [Vibrio sp. S4M6]|uniref:NRAMP family divalent metal transporter n=1 Tax=Vibrio sinus TaxID=2946865 RepID=UPI00202AB7A7|nr:divalent metal cation transporter [Vibrio sinus]MCL9780574.1 divalent metal cation transporter [Vibrio sinus]